MIEADEGCCGDIKELMRDTGLQLDAVGQVREAADMLREHGGDYQLLLLDWDVCGRDGARSVRELGEAAPEARILILADCEAEGVEEALSAERTGILTKPFFVSAFRDKVAELWADVGRESAPEPLAVDSLAGLRFLAAEDNEINAEILKEILEMEGASCEIVENGCLAVERFRNGEAGEFDAILMDVQMPVMNGHDAARAIRALEGQDGARIPIIAMTANAFAEDEKAARDAGMDAHVAKPLDVELLKKAVAQCTKRES